jgi:hypothetical protein
MILIRYKQHRLPSQALAVVTDRFWARKPAVQI